jgi:hypothetical protein
MGGEISKANSQRPKKAQTQKQQTFDIWMFGHWDFAA